MEDDLPGAEIIARGLEDLANGVESIPALLVAIGAPRLRGLMGVPDGLPDEPNSRLYRLLGAQVDDPHPAYNAWIRRLARYERAAEMRQEHQRRRIA